jgi:hypothetical protein
VCEGRRLHHTGGRFRGYHLSRKGQCGRHPRGRRLGR